MNYDVIIVGAGIVGQTLALGLGKQGMSVAIIDSGKEPLSSDIKQDSFESRVSAISWGSQQLLNELGAWEHIQRKQEYLQMDVSDQDGFGHIQFTQQELIDSIGAVPLGSVQPSLGHIIENKVLIVALQNCINQHKNITCFFERDICELDNTDTHASVIIKQGELAHTHPTNLTAKLMVGADGANSVVRESFGLKHSFYDYEHTAIVCNVETSEPHHQVAKQVFTPFGPLAFLPLPDPNQCSIVFSQQSARALEILSMSELDLAKLLRVTVDNHYGECKIATPVASFELRMRYARSWISSHVALVGDAAHTIHPLAGQGANLGLGDVKTLLELVSGSPDKLGSYSQLRRYERCRKAEAVKVIATMQGFKSLFDGDNTVKRVVRNTGLMAASQVTPLKKFFIKQAMG